MDGREELVLRCARRRAAELGGLSHEAFDELLLAVRADVSSFISTDEERAFALVVRELERYDAEGADDEMLDDDAYLAERRRRFDVLDKACAQALEIDPGCLDARLIRALVADLDPDDLLEVLLAIDADAFAAAFPDGSGTAGDAWLDLEARPALRVRAAAARTCLESARYRMASELCESLVACAPSDALGARLTWSLALARLEDEEGFAELGTRFGHHDNAWSHLGHTLLLYKLDHMAAARRALRGFCTLCEGGAYALLRPAFVETYLPDRPAFRPGSFEEALMATHEADPIIVDTPDFVSWAQRQDGVIESAQRFADENGYDW